MNIIYTTDFSLSAPDSWVIQTTHLPSSPHDCIMLLINFLSASFEVYTQVWLKVLFIRYATQGYTEYTQMNGAVSKVNKKFISHLTRAQRTPSAAATVQVSHQQLASHAYYRASGPASKWRRSKKTLSVFSVLRCQDLWLQCSVSFVHGLEKTHHAWCVFSKSMYENPCRKLMNLFILYLTILLVYYTV